MSDLAKNKNKKPKFTTRHLVSCAMLSACSIILTYLEFPIFIAPGFYRLNISDLPALIGGFSMGPVVGIIVEFIKSLVMLLINPMNPSMGIGELSNFILGCAFVVPASIIYRKCKTKKRAFFALVFSGLLMSAVATIVNAFVLIPMYESLYSMDVVAAGSAIFPFIDNMFEFCMVCVLPFNLIKAFVVSAITMFVYKPLSMLIKGISNY